MQVVGLYATDKMSVFQSYTTEIPARKQSKTTKKKILSEL